MKCPHCNQEHPNTMNFCPNTGQKLYTKENKCTICGNTNVSMNDVFCNNCGSRLVETRSTPPNLSAKNINKEKKIVYVGGNIFTHIFAILLCVGSLIAGIISVAIGEYRIGITSIVLGCGMGWLFFVFPNK